VILIKLYVVENKIRTVDGDYLVQVLTYKSKPERFDYLIWI